MPKQIPSRAVVLTFDHTNWNLNQEVFVFAPDDTRSEGDRVVVVQHSVISNVPEYDAVDVRNVEVQVRDNDTPGIYVTQVEPGTSTEDGRTLVIEGGDSWATTPDSTTRSWCSSPGARCWRFHRGQDGSGRRGRRQIKLIDVLSDTRYDEAARTITFDHTNWNQPARRDRGPRRLQCARIRTAIITFERDAPRSTSTATTSSRTFAPAPACSTSR
jgi:hypothetical protein